MAEKYGDMFLSGETGFYSYGTDLELQAWSSSNVTIDYEIFKFGNASLRFDDGYLFTPKTFDYFDFEDEDFTLDVWVRRETTANVSLFSLEDGWNEPDRAIIMRLLNGRVDVLIGGPQIHFVSIDVISLNEWHHIALTRNGLKFTLWIDGEEDNTANSSYSVNTIDYDTVYLGRTDTYGENYTGWMDNFRITSNKAIWTAPFEITEEALFYPVLYPRLLSNMYKVVDNIRGEASNGFIRPTVKQFFMSSPEFEKIDAGPGEIIGYTEDVCTGGAPFASSEWAPDSRYDHHAFDNIQNTYWSSDANKSFPQHIGYRFASGDNKIINQYQIQASSSGNENYSPSEWIFQASNDNATWYDLDSQTSISFYGLQQKEFSFANITAYRYYRLLITDHNCAGDEYVIIDEIEMREGIYE